jgi:hypothetical protein
MKRVVYVLGHYLFELNHYLARKRARRTRRPPFRARYRDDKGLTVLVVLLLGFVITLLLTFS